MENDPVITRTTIVKNEFGIHARPASRIAQIAASARSDIWLNVNSKKVDASSIIDILTLSAVKGSQVVVEIADQTDQDILDQIVEFFEDGFGED